MEPVARLWRRTGVTRTIAVLAAAMLLSGVLGACSAATSGHRAITTHARAATGTLTGRFSEFAEGRGGAAQGVVRIYATKHMVGPPLARARSDANGTYEIALRPGTYYATGSSENFHIGNPPIGICGVGPITIKAHEAAHANIRCIAH